MSALPNKKYRPVLSSTAIAHIVALAKSESPLTLQSIEVISTLSPFLAKIENEGIVAAYTVAPPKPSIEESLGMVAPTPFLTKEEGWEYCYNKYLLDPTLCSMVEINAAREHMYLEGLMSKEEVAEFESNQK